ncbi:MAG TPA: hypothetical protein VMX17_05150 [Candidatus Glassbacteria bacterium]|nr:hypothetical protein [Candidatus Glassbacteria bacterium]
MVEKKRNPKRNPKGAGRKKIPVIVDDLKTDGFGKLKPKPVDLEQVMHWIDIGATAEEIAGSYRISSATLYNKLLEYTGFNFSELKTKASGKAKIKLRESQFKLAETNSTMSIWLGKNLLGQTDNSVKTVEDLHTLVDYIQKTPKEKIEKDFAQPD